MVKPFLVMGLVLGFAGVAAAQATDGPFQVQFVGKLKKKDVINISNSGASSSVAIPQNGALCANIYAFSTAGPMLGCCACKLAANSLSTVPIVADVLGSPKPLPKGVVLKMIASTGNAGVCSPSTVATGINALATGMLGWRNDERFAPATLSVAEVTNLNTQCSLLHPTPSICASCAEPTS